MTRKLRNRIKKKAKLYKKAKTSKNWDRYKSFQKACKREFKRAEQDYITRAINKGIEQKNHKPFWRYIKSKKSDNIGISPLKQDGNLFYDSKTKAEILLNQFKSVFTKSDGVIPDTQKCYPDIDNLVVTEDGVRKLLQNINTSKAAGPDLIPNIVLKQCAKEIAPSLTSIFNESIETGAIPKDWRDANISPIFKKGDKHSPENYRPVSLTSVTCKLLEHIICKHLITHLEKYNILTSLNHGFRSGYSCETQLLLTIDDLTKNYNSGTQTDVAILDCSKAFDTVPHDKLLSKLRSYGVTDPHLSWLSNFLSKRTMRVMCEGAESSDAYVESGVPQGTVLGPLLFLCHINDLPERVRSQVRLFADDCLLYRPINSSDDQTILQEDLKELEEWANTWGMRFNAKKC